MLFEYITFTKKTIKHEQRLRLQTIPRSTKAIN